MGVFATRSPFRPNPIGLSCVRLERIESSTADGPVLHVAGADLMDGTPIYDIKPYLPYVDCHPEATGGFAQATQSYAICVDFPEPLLKTLPEEKRRAAVDMLAQDPRPGYRHDDDERRYGVAFAGYDIRFSVSGGVLRVFDVVPLDPPSDP